MEPSSGVKSISRPGTVLDSTSDESSGLVLVVEAESVVDELSMPGSVLDSMAEEMSCFLFSTSLDSC